MPKTKGEKLFLSIVMSVVMVYGMELYNLAVQAGGLQNELFGRVFADLPLMCLCSCWRLLWQARLQRK